jgi:glycosyltransferase involved in cell wall biosynthesis
MRFLLLNQTFYPDVVATAQYLAELAIALAEKGHEVTVICSNRAYDDLSKRFPTRESWRGIDIHRVGSLGLGKGAKWKRAADFASFFGTAVFKTLLLPRHDAVIALTSPPLISALGAWLAKRWRARFFYWVMDLNPDEAIAAGWLRADSFAAKMLDKISRYSLRNSEKVIVLDRFMRERIEAKGIPSEKIATIPPWSHDDEVQFDSAGRDAFRERHGLTGKFVVMYSGNHSPCHPLDTLLGAAKILGSTGGSPVPFGAPPKAPALDPRPSTLDIVFCFVGGGSEWRKIHDALRTSHFERQTSNILCLPYQPLNELSGSLSAADLHVVVMGEPFVGTIHPCKIYNILNIGAPVLYIGPRAAHVPEIFEAEPDEHFYSAQHGDAEAVAEQIRCAQKQQAKLPVRELQEIGRAFSKSKWLPQLVRLLEGTSKDAAEPAECKSAAR